MIRTQPALLCLLIAVGAIPACSDGPANGAAPASAAATAAQANEEPKAEPIIQATPSELVKAYEENTVAADELYKGKQIKVTGKVADISTDMLDNPYITMQGGNQFMPPQFSFDKEHKADLAKLKKGKSITVICTGGGDIAKTPMLKDCKLQ